MVWIEKSDTRFNSDCVPPLPLIARLLLIVQLTPKANQYGDSKERSQGRLKARLTIRARCVFLVAIRLNILLRVAGHEVPITHQEAPGHQTDLPIKPASTKLPTEDGGYQMYKAAGKLTDKKALITGGDSGIGRAVAILFAMEGADSMIAYLPDEEKDAQETKRRVEEAGRKCHLFPTDLTSVENCQKVADAATAQLGRVNILVNNHAYQMMKNDISELSIDQWHKTFNTNIHPFFYLSKMLLPQMKSGDTIINNASINAYIGRPDLLDYTSTKGGLSHLYPSQMHRLLTPIPSNRLLHPRPAQPTDQQRHPSQRRRARSSLDTSYPCNDEQRSTRSILISNGSTQPAERNCLLFCVLGEYGQQ